MKIDYNKTNFSSDEKHIMAEESAYNSKENPDHLPVLVQLKSNVLKMEKQKYLINKEILFSEFVTTILKKKLINLNSDDTLVIHVVKLTNPPEYLEIQPISKPIKEIYDEYKDTDTNLLILRISRNTTFKYVKNYIKYLTGYKK